MRSGVGTLDKFHAEGGGVCYLDSNGMPVEYTEYALGVGNPGDIVLIAYLLPGSARMPLTCHCVPIRSPGSMR